MALVATAALGLGMTACGGGTIGYMWVLGTYYNQISGFKIDDYTGNLTAITALALLLRRDESGGRWWSSRADASSSWSTPAPARPARPAPPVVRVARLRHRGLLGRRRRHADVRAELLQPGRAAGLGGARHLRQLPLRAGQVRAELRRRDARRTAPSLPSPSTASTGRLTLVPNTAVLTNQIPQTWFEVGPNPIMSKIGWRELPATRFRRTSIYPYRSTSSNGQLTVPTDRRLPGHGVAAADLDQYFPGTARLQATFT